MDFQTAIPMSCVLEHFKDNQSNLKHGCDRPFSDLRGRNFDVKDAGNNIKVTKCVTAAVSPSFTSCKDTAVSSPGDGESDAEEENGSGDHEELESASKKKSKKKEPYTVKVQASVTVWLL